MSNTGFKQNVFWGAEGTTDANYGSAGTIDETFGLVQSINPTETNNLIKVRTLGGTRDYSNIVPGKFEVSGTIDYYIQNGVFLRMAMGEDSGSAATTDSGPRTHTGAALASSCVHTMGSASSPIADEFPSFSIEFNDDEDAGGVNTTNLKRLYTGCKVNSLTISAAVDEPLSVSCDWIAQGVTVSTADATTGVSNTDDPYVFYQGAVYCTSVGINYSTSVGGTTNTAVAEVNSFDFTVNNNLEPVWYISGTTQTQQTKRGLKKLLVKGRDYESSLGLHFRDKTMYQRFLGSNSATAPADTLGKFQVVMDFVRTGTIGTKSTSDDYMRIVMGSCAFNDINIPGTPEDIVSQNIGVFVKSAKIHVVDQDITYA